MKRPTNGGSEAPRELVSSELVEACKKGDEVAWARLVEATHREVYSLCLRILRDPHDAAEATQDAYLKAWRALGGFRGEAMFRPGCIAWPQTQPSASNGVESASACTKWMRTRR